LHLARKTILEPIWIVRALLVTAAMADVVQMVSLTRWMFGLVGQANRGVQARYVRTIYREKKYPNRRRPIPFNACLPTGRPRAPFQVQAGA